LDEECLGFYERALAEVRAIERPEFDEGADEHEALRGRLLRVLRRQPGDVRALLRHAESLSRMAAAEQRMSPRKREEFAGNLERVLSRFGDLIVRDDPG